MPFIIVLRAKGLTNFLNFGYGFNVVEFEFYTKLLFNSYVFAFASPKVSWPLSINKKILHQFSSHSDESFGIGSGNVWMGGILDFDQVHFFHSLGSLFVNVIHKYCRERAVEEQNGVQSISCVSPEPLVINELLGDRRRSVGRAKFSTFTLSRSH